MDVWAELIWCFSNGGNETGLYSFVYVICVQIYMGSLSEFSIHLALNKTKYKIAYQLTQTHTIHICVCVYDTFVLNVFRKRENSFKIRLLRCQSQLMLWGGFNSFGSFFLSFISFRFIYFYFRFCIGNFERRWHFYFGSLPTLYSRLRSIFRCLFVFILVAIV